MTSSRQAVKPAMRRPAHQVGGGQHLRSVADRRHHLAGRGRPPAQLHRRASSREFQGTSGTATISTPGSRMHFEVLVEDPSGKRALDIVMPRIIGEHDTFRVIAYRGIGHVTRYRFGLPPALRLRHRSAHAAGGGSRVCRRIPAYSVSLYRSAPTARRLGAGSRFLGRKAPMGVTGESWASGGGGGSRSNG